MIKESTTPGSPYAMMAVTPANGYAFQYNFGSHVSGGPYTFPAWVKLTRTGNTIAGYTSTDGIGWNLVGTAAVPMATDVTVGLFVTSHNGQALGTAQFDNVAVSDAPAIAAWNRKWLSRSAERFLRYDTVLSLLELNRPGWSSRAHLQQVPLLS